MKLLYRARYLCLLVVGEDHPEVALVDSNIGLILHAVGEYDLSLRFLEKALELNVRFHGEQSLKVAVSYHLVARVNGPPAEAARTLGALATRLEPQVFVKSYGLRTFFVCCKLNNMCAFCRFVLLLSRSYS